MNLFATVVGSICVLIGIVEIFTGVAWEKTGYVYRQKKPGLFWFSVMIKIAVGLAIMNYQRLQAILGA